MGREGTARWAMAFLGGNQLCPSVLRRKFLSRAIGAHHEFVRAEGFSSYSRASSGMMIIGETLLAQKFRVAMNSTAWVCDGGGEILLGNRASLFTEAGIGAWNDRFPAQRRPGRAPW